MNLKEELEKYKEFDIDEISSKTNNSFLDEFGILLTQVKNQTKQHFRFVQEIEYLKNEISQNTASGKQLVEEVLTDQANIKRQNKILTRCLIDIYDLVYNSYEISLEAGSSSLSSPAEKLFKEAQKNLFNIGFIPIDKAGVPYDSEIHYVIKTESLKEYENNSIIRILRPGFIFEGKVIRKSDVIVNKLQES